VLHDLRPLLAQLDPALRQVTPILDFVGLYKPELTAFFANTVAATQAQDPGTKLHYLRTMNPLNLENLAVYPRRLGTNRTNAYAKPGNFRLLGKGMPSFETRHCNRAVPGITNTEPPGGGVLPTQVLQQLIPQQLLDNLNKFVLSQATNSQTAAPPCYPQGPYTVSGETTQYPHVKAK
jgi:hypothetical protein